MHLGRPNNTGLGRCLLRAKLQQSSLAPTRPLLRQSNRNPDSLQSLTSRSVSVLPHHSDNVPYWINARDSAYCGGEVCFLTWSVTSATRTFGAE